MLHLLLESSSHLVGERSYNSTHPSTNKKLRLESIKLQSGYEPDGQDFFQKTFSNYWAKDLPAEPRSANASSSLSTMDSSASLRNFRGSYCFL